MVANTGAMFKTFTFDNENSRNYGVYISGEAVYNAPDRDVDMITIPGRNGSFAKDNGRFENIEVTYPAGVFADSKSDFADAISDLRNMLCSKKGYCRLQDDYNPDEYRLAVYKSGLEVNPSFLRAGEFSITFECKPQRFLTSGETKTAISSGGTIINPTLFESSPLLELFGYGEIDINSDTIKIDDVKLGVIRVMENQPPFISRLTGGGITAIFYSIDTNHINANDRLFMPNSPYIEMEFNSTEYIIDGITITSISSNGNGFVNVYSQYNQKITLSFQDIGSFLYNSGSSQTKNVYLNWTLNSHSGAITNSTTGYMELNINCSATGGNIRYAISTAVGDTLPANIKITTRLFATEIFADSTVQATGNPLYIDLDIGNAWNEDFVTPISSNNAVTLPAKLPTLKPGSNTITYDNTITNCKIIPRWWKV